MKYSEIQKKFGSPLPSRHLTWEQMLKANQQPPKEHTRPQHHEDRLQIQCVQWFALQYPALSPLLHHSPNGGARSKAEGSIFKAMGVRAGFPDLFLYHPAKGFHGLAIEMKTTEKGSTQRPTQKQWQAQLESEGYHYTICRTLEEFQTTIKDYLQ